MRCSHAPQQPLARSRIQQNFNETFTPHSSERDSFDVMIREAFVLRLGPETEPSRRHFVGWIEEVDTGEEFRFRSTDELLAFLGQRFNLVQQHRKPQQEDEASS